MTTDRRRHFEDVWKARNESGARDLGIHGNIRAQKALSLLSGGDRFLDVGCGAGDLGQAVVSRFVEVHGVDLSASAVEEARAKGIRAHVCDAGAEPLPFPDASFDAVTAMSVLQFVVDPSALLRDCRRVLRPGGQFILAVPNLRAAWRTWKLVVLGQLPRTSLDPVGIDGGTLHYFTSRSICGLLDAAGFEILRSSGIHCRPRWLERRWNRAPLIALKREWFSGEVLVDARARRAPTRSPA